MLVRIKSRGELPPPCNSSFGNYPNDGRPSIVAFRGCCVEVRPRFECNGQWDCGGNIYELTDARVLGVGNSGTLFPGICSHYLIDDLNVYDSDSSDEQAEIGDLAMAEVVRPVEVKR